MKSDDGFRVIARKNGKRVRLYSRSGNDLTYHFPLIVEALAKLRSRSCIIDGEAVACGDDGIALFDRIRYRHHDADVFLYAFDLIELDGDDLRREPLNVRKATLPPPSFSSGVPWDAAPNRSDRQTTTVCPLGKTRPPGGRLTSVGLRPPSVSLPPAPFSS